MPGSLVTANVQTFFSELHTSPPHALPLSKQSRSLVHGVSPPSSPPTPVVPSVAMTLPPPPRSLILPILFAEISVNQRFLSGPTAMSYGSEASVGMRYSDT